VCHGVGHHCSNNIKRFIGVTSIATEKDDRLGFMIDTVLRHTVFAGFISDMRLMEVYLQQKAADLDWTVVKPPGLSDGTTCVIADYRMCVFTRCLSACPDHAPPQTRLSTIWWLRSATWW